MEIPLCVIYCFSLAAFNVCYLCLIFVSLINMCLGVFPILGKLLTIISSSIFSCPFLCLLLLGLLWFECWAFNFVPEVSEVVLISFNSFSFFPLCFIYFHNSIFHLTYPLFCLSYSAVGSLQSVFNLSCSIVLYWSVPFSSCSVMSDSLRPHESQHTRPPCPSPTPGVHLDSRPSSQQCHPVISSSVVPSPPAPNPSQHQSLFQWVNSSHEVAKVLEFQL